MIKIVIAEDHQALIDGMKIFIGNETDMEVVGEANNGEQLVEVVSKKLPDVVLTDIRMPKMDGITATGIIKKRFPQIKIIAFSMFEQEDAIALMKKAGASGYIMKNLPMHSVVDAIRTVIDEELYFEDSLKTAKKDSENLSNREKEILRLIGQGKTTLEIADLLCIGKTTVDSHRKNLSKKLNITGKTELIRVAMDRKYDFEL